MKLTTCSTTLLLLAHQDDEIAVAPLISQLKQQQAPVRIIYLTDGGGRGVSSTRRDAESRRALASLGVRQSEILFLGSRLCIPDGLLFRNLKLVYDELESEIRTIVSIGDIYTLAWEGGHVDHDAVHVIAARLAAANGLLNRTWQVPFYRAADLGAPWFSLFAPLKANGPYLELRLRPHEARLWVAMMRFYPSQWRSFIGLGAPLIYKALFEPTLNLQPIMLARLLERPTKAVLLYERRSGVDYREFAEALKDFVAESCLGSAFAVNDCDVGTS